MVGLSTVSYTALPALAFGATALLVYKRWNQPTVALFWPECWVWRLLGWNPNLHEFIRALEECKESIDICVMYIQHPELKNVIRRLGHRHVKIRILTDTMLFLRGKGIETRCMWGSELTPSYRSSIMHHKFIVLDGKRVFSGSLNWSLKAINFNNDGVSLLKDRRIVNKYAAEFEELWSMYDPKNCKKSAARKTTVETLFQPWCAAALNECSNDDQLEVFGSL